MLKSYRIISGLYGVLKGTNVESVEFEYEHAMLDLAEVNAVHAGTYRDLISNSTEYNRRRDEKWREENPNPLPTCHEPSLMGFMMPCELPCVTIQIGTKTFHFDEDPKVMFDIVCAEKTQ